VIPVREGLKLGRGPSSFFGRGEGENERSRSSKIAIALGKLLLEGKKKAV